MNGRMPSARAGRGANPKAPIYQTRHLVNVSVPRHWAAFPALLGEHGFPIIAEPNRVMRAMGLLRSEIQPPSEAGIVAAMSACGGMD